MNVSRLYSLYGGGTKNEDATQHTAWNIIIY